MVAKQFAKYTNVLTTVTVKEFCDNLCGVDTIVVCHSTIAWVSVRIRLLGMYNMGQQ